MDDTTSRPCYRGECDHHPHQPCDLGWLGPGDKVCPCWSARRRLVVNHTGPPDHGRPAPMPAVVRAAWNTAASGARPLPRSGPSSDRAAQPAAAPDAPAPVDPRAAAVLAELGLDAARAGSSLRLARALVVAAEAGWPEADLIELLKSTEDPDGRPPTLLWTWTVEHLGTPTTSNGARP
jgi:hypothetical protein